MYGVCARSALVFGRFDPRIQIRMVQPMHLLAPLIPTLRNIDDCLRAAARSSILHRWAGVMSVLLLLAGSASLLSADAPPLHSLEPVTLQFRPLAFHKSVPDDKPAIAARALPPTLDELMHLIRSLQRTEHIRANPKLNQEIAAAILNATARWPLSPLDLLALGWIESRLRPDARSGSGACGMFQQLPRYARPYPVGCDRLSHPALSAWHAGAFIQAYQRRWGSYWVCHYNGGMICGPRAIQYAMRYHEVHHWLEKELVRLRHPVTEQTVIAEQPRAAASGGGKQ
jgi:hypothetical protein